jgi:chaperonin GroEL (HSP60 family)
MTNNGSQTDQHLLGEGVQRTTGTDARRYNFLAAKLIAELIKHCLGPRGLDKIFIDIMGEVTVTKDGATLLRKIDVDHPAAKVLIEASNAVDNEVGDGTISVVVLAGALLENAEEMMDRGIAPSTIADGYLLAKDIALSALDRLSHRYQNFDRKVMLQLVSTCLRSKILSYAGDHIADQIIDAVMTVADLTRKAVEVDDIKIEGKLGSISDTQLVRGIVLDKTIDSSSMPKVIENAKIILIDDDLEGKRTKREAEIEITSPTQIKEFKDRENAIVRSKIQHIIDSGANVVISRKGINTFAQHLLAQEGIISVRRVKENDLVWLAKATGATITEKLDHDEKDAQGHYHFQNTHGHGPYYFDNNSEYGSDHHHHHLHHHDQHHNEYESKGNNELDQYYQHRDIDIRLGYAARVYEKFVGDDKIVFVEGCKNPKAITLLLRANSREALDECRRSALDAISVLKNFVLRPAIVPGGGASEAAIAKQLRKQATSVSSGKEQIAIQKFADALEEIPITIARNAGMDGIDTLAYLRSKHANGDKLSFYGIDAIARRVEETFPKIIDPTLVKEQVIKTAVEVTDLLIRVDDVLLAKPVMYTHTHGDGTSHSHRGGDKEHRHDYFDRLGKQQRPIHHYY